MTNLRLRLKHPSGAEFEAEGPAEFILTEKENFLKTMDAGGETGRKTAAAQKTETAQPENPDFWGRLTVKKNDLNILRTKPPEMTAREAALVLLAAARATEGARETSAIELSRAIKASGYLPDRLDRLLAGDIKAGRITASGTKRNRTYAIKDPGMEAAWFAARKADR